jgi:hypothetical protein
MYLYRGLYGVIRFPPSCVLFAFVTHEKLNLAHVLTPQLSNVWALGFVVNGLGISNKNNYI